MKKTRNILIDTKLDYVKIFIKITNVVKMKNVIII